MKRRLALIVVTGLLSSGSSQAFQGLDARLSLDRPYRQDNYPPMENAGRRVRFHPMSFRQENNPVPFNIFHYVRGENGGLKLAIYFK